MRGTPPGIFQLTTSHAASGTINTLTRVESTIATDIRSASAASR
jgi:hypothetical protein